MGHIFWNFKSLDIGTVSLFFSFFVIIFLSSLLSLFFSFSFWILHFGLMLPQLKLCLYFSYFLSFFLTYCCSVWVCVYVSLCVSISFSLSLFLSYSTSLPSFMNYFLFISFEQKTSGSFVKWKRKENENENETHLLLLDICGFLIL